MPVVEEQTKFRKMPLLVVQQSLSIWLNIVCNNFKCVTNLFLKVGSTEKSKWDKKWRNCLINIIQVWFSCWCRVLYNVSHQTCSRCSCVIGIFWQWRVTGVWAVKKNTHCSCIRLHPEALCLRKASDLTCLWSGLCGSSAFCFSFKESINSL